MFRFVRFIFILPILFYKRVISPFLPHVCRFEPSCSTYMIEAINKYGVTRGILKGIWRICRCNPWCRGGHDPP
ncbi:MAG: membrane protein insertion efficiency factor YidD [Planctomycetaceae bacterium]|nr:membrane protein insertion efficiency factor YidD [Planctomycetaceae bacterium]